MQQTTRGEPVADPPGAEPSFRYPDEIEEIRHGLTTFVQREVSPRHEANSALFDDPRAFYGPDRRRSPEIRALVSEVRQAAVKAGYYTMCTPEALGGGGLGHLAYFAAWERIYHLCGGQYFLGQHVIAHWATGPSPVLSNLTPQAKAEIMTPLMEGRATMCFGLSEPGAGSDATMIKTLAKRDGDGWRISGTKIWTTNSPHADYVIVFAVTDPAGAAEKAGISAFLVPVSAPGFHIEQIVRMWGSVGGDEAVLTFDEVRVEPYQLVGQIGRGFATAMYGVNLGRIYNTARAVGASRWALEKAFDYIAIRKAFGHAIAEYQGVTFPLADSLTDIHAARLMAVNVARMLDAGLPARKELAMTKGFAVRAATRAIDNAIQAHGAMGVTNEMHLTEAYAALRNVNIADGSNEILRRSIVKEALAGDTAV
jgi:alkylation response protein AidB-like acyl-CoA dehydrogenase